MTLKEELEILRGEPIEVFTGDPMDIPCIETSDAEKLCKHPVVSVNMITYNHEPYIRQAIEGVMMQKTDFEFELIIGEDCSQDKTREICFEYQKRYPDKIRVLWWHENVSKLGGNSRRARARCRGEFMALCEGDDYWMDPLKLQKQVEVMRLHGSVGLCFSNAVIRDEDTGSETHWQGAYQDGFCSGRDFMRTLIFGIGPLCQYPSGVHINTATCLVRKSVLDCAVLKFDIFNWMLCLGDTIIWLGIASLSDVYYISQDMALYRKHGAGATSRNISNILRDGWIVRKYYADELRWKHVYKKEYQCLLRNSLVALVGNLSRRGGQVKTGIALISGKLLGESALFSRYMVVSLVFLFGVCNNLTRNFVNRYLNLLAIVLNDGVGAYIRRKN